MILNMDRHIVILCLVLIIHKASSTPTSTAPSSNPAKNQQLVSTKPLSSYQVTEDVIDIPDDRTLPPIVTNFSIFKPIYLANASVNINKNSNNDTGDENNQVKRTSFTYVHFTKEPDKFEEGGIKKLFHGIKDYVYGLKKGVVDGLHSFFHNKDGNGIKKDIFYDKFHRSNVNIEKKEAEDDFYDTIYSSNVHVQNKEKNIDFHNKFHRSYDSEENSHEFDHEVFKHEFEDY